MPIQLDLNNPIFQAQFVALEKDEVLRVISTFRKLLQMEWNQIYADQGLKWEYIASKDVYSLRASQRIRISATRRGELLVVLAIHPDHDSAYE